MKRLVILCGIALMVLVVGCQQTEVPPVVEGKPSLAIMVESDSSMVEAGSSFVISGSNFKPKQLVFAYFEYRAINRTEAHQVHDEADEQGSIHLTIEVPEDIVPGDYEVKISTGVTLDIKDRQLIATLPIPIKAKGK